MDISNLSIKQLEELSERCLARVEQLRKSAAADVRAELIALAKEKGFDAVSLLTGKAVSEKVRRPAKAKYRDPASGATWTGRGLKPKWLAQALAAGKKLESFLI
jgi:DNA-binding protein H-NS